LLPAKLMPESTPNYTLADIAFLKGDTQAPIDDEKSGGRAFLAVSGAMVWPGLGHLLAARRGWAVFWCIMWTVLVATALSTLAWPDLIPVLVVVLPLAILAQFCQLAHAARCAERSQAPMLGDKSSRFMVGFMLAVLGLGECYAAITYLQNNFIEICYSPTDSMGPNISPGDFFLNFRQSAYARWDIVGANPPPELAEKFPNLVKRIAGLPGDTLEITGPGLLVNGKLTTLPAEVGPYVPVDTWNTPLSDAEPLSAANGCWGKPITLALDEYFLLGDNSSVSDDARFWPAFANHQAGATPKDQLCGRIVAIIWPPQRWRVFPHAGN
jgi:signal peptidase I